MAVTTKPKPGTITVGAEIKKLSGAAKNFWVTNPKAAGNSATGLIAYYWLKAGGDPRYVNRAVAASLAESSGNASAVSPPNSDGSRDVGYWQINTVHGPNMATTDPIGNARAAIVLSHNGTDWSAWCTSYDDGICHPEHTASPHYKGAGLGNYQTGAPVLAPGIKQFVYAKDAMAGAIWGANNVAGGTVGLSTPFDPVGSDGQPLTNKWGAALGNATGITAPIQAAEDLGQVLGGGTVGKVLAYAGYGLLAAFGALILLLALAILVLALVERQNALAAVPGLGKFAGAAGEVKGAVNARAVNNQSAGSSSARRSRVVRRIHGEKGRAPATLTPTHGGTPGQRRARRVHDAGVNPRARYPHRLPTRQESGAPF